MTVLGFNIGQSRLAEVVGAVNATRFGSGRNVDVFYGLRLADCDQQQLEAIHYDWASCCDRRMFAVVGPDDVAMIRRIGLLAQMFDVFVLTQDNGKLREAIESVNPQAAVYTLAEVAVSDPDDVVDGDSEGLPMIVVDCLDDDGTFSISMAADFFAAASMLVDDVVPAVAEAATDVAGGE